jgi:hypothetical protein
LWFSGSHRVATMASLGGDRPRAAAFDFELRRKEVTLWMLLTEHLLSSLSGVPDLYLSLTGGWWW